MWVSVDAASKSGVALWDGARLVTVVTVRAMGGKGQWAHWSHGVRLSTWGTRWQALRAMVSGMVTHLGEPDDAKAIVVATERGGMRNADRALGRAVGYLDALADYTGARLVDVELSTWRRAIADAMTERGTPITWPAGETKAVAVRVARELYPQLGADVTDDEAEAVLIGHAARRLRLVHHGQ